MDNDEKSTSRDHETPPESEAREKDRPDNENDEFPYEGLMSEEDSEKSAGDVSNTIVFPSTSEQDDHLPLDAGYGMPNFDLPEGYSNEPRKEASEPLDGVTAAKAGLEKPLNDGTGWENISSIEKPSIYEAFESRSAEQTYQPQEAQPERSEAKVMPFPGSSVPRPSEPEPSELLRGVADYGGADLFGPQAGETAEAVPDFDPSAEDSIADAVQSALKNVYGRRPDDDRDDEPVDPGSYTVAESLKRAAAADLRGEAWADSDQGWDDGRDSYYGSSQRADDWDARLDPLPDYPYSNRQDSRHEPTILSEESSLRDYHEASGYAQDWPDDINSGAHQPHRADMREYGPVSFRDHPGRYPEPGEARFARDGNYSEMHTGNVPDWVAPPYNPGGMPKGQYPATIPVQNTESLAANSPDSSHLLGAAGLGLIGGIALAGVLAVFVFNSFVEEGSEDQASAAPKVVERLQAPSVAEAPQAAVNEEPIGAEQPSSNTQFANLPDETAPPLIEQAPPQPAPASTTSSDGKLSVADAAGKPGAFVPLDIQLSEPVDRESTLLSLKGLPVEARLSIGIDVGGGQWLLPPSQLNDLTVTAPEEVAGDFDLEVQLLRDDAQTPLSEPVLFNLSLGEEAETPRPVTNSAPSESAALPSANADQAAQLAEVSEGTPEIQTDFLTQMLIQDGNKLMRDGDILNARRLYEQAAANGNPEAALAMGRSFDPSYFEKLPVKTGKPDPATAFQWYKKALDGGLVTARVKIDGLKQWLQR